jgi:hypothetical protein
MGPGDPHGLADSLRFFLTTDPREAEAILRAHDARWVLTVATPPATLVRYAVALGVDPRRADFEATTAVALHARNGSAVASAPAAHDHLRLRWAAGDAAKLFEYVAGARVSGSGAPPGSEVLVRVDLDVEGRGWMWFAGARADDGGGFELRVPYATDGRLPGNVRVRRAALRAGDRAIDLTIPGPAVEAGDTVAVDLRS